MHKAMSEKAHGADGTAQVAEPELHREFLKRALPLATALPRRPLPTAFDPLQRIDLARLRGLTITRRLGSLPGPWPRS